MILCDTCFVSGEGLNYLQSLRGCCRDAAEGGHAMLDGFDEQSSVAKTGSPGAFEQVGDPSLNIGNFTVLFADKGDARIGIGRAKGQRSRLS